MSIATKTGDEGMTGLMFNRRISKTDGRIEAYGTVDELNAALGLVRASSRKDFVGQNILAIQKDLVAVMGELATLPADMARYREKGYATFSENMTERLDKLIQEIEAQKITYEGWATPGANLSSATLDVARTVCRRAERQIWGLAEKGQLENPLISVFLNRLSDLLWLFARWTEQRPPD
jgi:cob(I)alamin adenosyltransferase